MRENNLEYEWNDVAVLVDQRSYTMICKTMLKLSQNSVQEIQDVILHDWTWQNESPCTNELSAELVSFQGKVTLQLCYLNHHFQQGIFFVDVPVQGAWQEPLTEQNRMRLVFYHTQVAEEHILLETVLQINRNQILDSSQVLIGQFQMEEMLTLEEPWPSCDTLLASSVTLELQEWQIVTQQLQLSGMYHIVCVYQSIQQSGEQVFIYENRLPMKATILVPEGLCEIDSVIPYYQNIAVQLFDTEHIQITGNGVFCTLPVCQSKRFLMRQTDFVEKDIAAEVLCQSKSQKPSVINSRGSRKANLSKYMRNLNSAVETPKFIRNFEINTENEVPN